MLLLPLSAVVTCSLLVSCDACFSSVGGLGQPCSAVTTCSPGLICEEEVCVLPGYPEAGPRPDHAIADLLLCNDASGPCCGNRVVEEGEACDDGNRSDGDHCSHDCMVRCECDSPKCIASMTFADHCYQILSSCKWRDAQAECLNAGMDLVSIGSEEENAFLYQWKEEQLFLHAPVWIGLNDLDQEGHFVWSNGEDVVYTNWHVYQPDNGGGGEDCVELQGDPSTWNDHDCNVSKSSICED